MNEKIITVFGSSYPKPGEREYDNAYELGKLLAKEGFGICSGGMQGIMDAVSKGAIEEGKPVIGITMKIFNSIATKHLTSEIKCDTLFERIDNLLMYGDGYIILPGGTGTLLELSAVWELINKNIIKEKPIVCLGNFWENIVGPVEERLFLEKKKTGLIKCVNTVEETVGYLKQIII